MFAVEAGLCERTAAVEHVARLADLLVETNRGTQRAGSLEWVELPVADDGVQVLYTWTWNDNGEPIDPHRHNVSMEHVIVVRGRVTVYVGNGCFPLEANQSVVVPPGVVHSITPELGARGWRGGE